MESNYMFNAYSDTLKTLVNIQDVYDLKEIFKCPYPECPAEFKIRSIDGKKATHFFRFRGAKPHIKNCPYDTNKGFSDSDKIIKSSLESILIGSINKTSSRPRITTPQTTQASSNNVFIRTPKQLLSYCLASRLETQFRDGLIVNDIIVDSRNLVMSKYYEGVRGIRLLVGETVNFESPNRIYMQIREKTSKTHRLNVMVTCNYNMQKTTSVILKTYHNTFKHHPIAILADWEITEKYHVQAIISNQTQIIVKFQ